MGQCFTSVGQIYGDPETDLPSTHFAIIREGALPNPYIAEELVAMLKQVLSKQGYSSIEVTVKAQKKQLVDLKF